MRNKLSGWLFRKVLFVSGFSMITACEYENAEINSEIKQQSFATDIAPILINKCAVSGCHDGSIIIGNFNSFAEIRSTIDNGKFKVMVFDLKIMPPINSVMLTSTE